MTNLFITLFYILIFLLGICIGSFLNVCIYRIPKHEDIVKIRSHCMNCGYQLKWYDLVPLFSYLFLKGRCRKCGQKLSAQYPIVEAANGLLYVLVIALKGATLESLLYCLLFSALLVLSVIDWRTFEIPVGLNIFIAVLGVIRLVTDYRSWILYLAGAMAVSLFLLILYIATKGRAIGGGDIKLMAACGLLLGWKKILVAFAIGCITAAVVHLIRMKVSSAGKTLAMGPYLSVGVAAAALFGEAIINWYMGMYI